MAYQYEYISLTDVLCKIVQQAKKDVNWLKGQLPKNIDNPETLFYYLKSVTSYQDDPKNVELIQSPKSLFLKNWYGVPGRGDCDCFSCLTICALLALGYEPKDISIILTGRKPKEAVHIFIKIENNYFDLTNTFFGEIRKYPFYQKINIFELWQK
jgi:hypothetical protein